MKQVQMVFEIIHGRPTLVLQMNRHLDYLLPVILTKDNKINVLKTSYIADQILSNYLHDISEDAYKATSRANQE